MSTKRNNFSTKKITLDDISGYMSEKSAWRMILFAAERWNSKGAVASRASDFVIVDDKWTVEQCHALQPIEPGLIPPEEYCNMNVEHDKEKAAVWTIGALAFYAIMGVEIFDGMGGRNQTLNTQIPYIKSSHCSSVLSRTIHKCLDFNPSMRPRMCDITDTARKEIGKEHTRKKRLVTSTGKTYKSSIIDFWPEEIATIIITILMCLTSGRSMAQICPSTTQEMKNIIARCKMLRNKNNKDAVKREFYLDGKWTLMDELPIDKNGECTTKQPVDMLELNNMAYQICKSKNGVNNSGGRFRNGQDPRYNYSFIEITVRKGASVSYDITGRKGSQQIAVIPYKDGTAFTVSLKKNSQPTGTLTKADGVCFINVAEKVSTTDKLRLSIKNNSDRNMSFVIVNYNARN